ncbi:MAG: phosphate ABC transporter permease subunit PstC [Firmicutes bacterium]|nr:phosphate ABC transporter permease subunit PstC [Bacillota bacterium]MCL1954142.1 phosphate ABC transporter permease subunit PstC [Bacillota bacterium]
MTIQQNTTSKFIHVRERVIKYSLFSSAMFSVIALFAIVVFLLSRGIPAISQVGLWKFLFGTDWNPNASTPVYGIFPMILGSIYVTGLATIISLIFGLFIAIFLYKFCPKKFRSTIEQVINLLAAVPSIVYGLFGIMIVVPVLREIAPNFVGHGILASSIILSIMVLPTIVSISLSALRSVPRELYEGALALGATREQSVFKVIFPAARSGVYTAIILSIGRAIGETMAVIMVIGGSPQMPTSLFQSIDTLTALIARSAREESGFLVEVLIAVGVVLLFFALILNYILMKIKERKVAHNYKIQLKKNNEKANRSTIVGLTKFIIIVQEYWKIFWQTIGKSIKFVLTKPIYYFAYLLKITRLSLLWYKFWAWIDTWWSVHNRQTIKYKILKWWTYIASTCGVLMLLAILYFIISGGLPYLSWEFIFGKYTLDNPTLMPAIVGTLIVVGIALVIAIPIGVACAIFLSEYARQARGVKYLRLAIDSLAAIPSIVYGLFGFIVFVGIFGWDYSLIAGGLALSIMTLPTVIRITEESLLAVHHTYREASRALGASKVRTTFRIVLPSSLSGIGNAMIQTIGRAISESAVLILTIGMVVGVMPSNILSPGTTLSLNIYYFGNTLYPDQAAATGVVLLILVLILNLGLSLIVKLLSKKQGK